mgnify:CR=1 FL=1
MTEESLKSTEISNDMMSSSGEESGGKYSIKPNSMLSKAKLKALAKASEAKAPKRRQRLDYDAEDVLPSDEIERRLHQTPRIDLGGRS